MTKGIVINRVPIAADKRAHQQQQSRLRLVEIGDQLIHDMECITGFDHDLRLGMERLLTRLIQIIKESLQ